jgi:hypothetical protein
MCMRCNTKEREGLVDVRATACRDRRGQVQTEVRMQGRAGQ